MRAGGRLRTISGLFARLQNALTLAAPAQQPDWVQALLAKLPGWAQTLINVLIGSAGGWGLAVVAYIDSSFGTLPVINDALVIALSLKHPERMVFYATMASVGSILGCLTIFLMARKGGEMVLRKRASRERIERLRGWYEKNEFLTVAIPAVLPPPAPFKVFILAAGVFQVRLRPFLMALSLGRSLRYFLWGFLAVQFGEKAVGYLRTNYLQVSLTAAGLMLLVYLLTRLAARYRARRDAPAG